MKEIKAYIRTSAVAGTVDALTEAGAPGITVVTVHPVGYGFDPNFFQPERADPIKYSPSITKLEVVCKDDDVERFMEIISGGSYTGTRGDGMIFVSPIERAVKIRTSEQGDNAL